MSRTETYSPQAIAVPSGKPDASTRVFVSGLPPKFSGEQLAAHFRTKHQVTDAHVFPDRRIGFVGFLNSSEAEDAVNHFNRTYIRMSKILVDLAKPIEVTSDATGNAVPQSKRRLGHPRDNGADDIKKRKRRVNDDGEDLRTAGVPTQDVTPSADEGYKQEKTSELQKESEPTVKSTDDNDWLRGKTSRVLDLLGPEDEALSKPKNEIDQDHVQAETTHIGNDQNRQDHTDSSPDVEEQNAKIPNARLFVRNLAFGVTDADLRTRFGEFGKVQEAHIVKDARSSTSKGTAFVQFAEQEEAETAFRVLDGVAFHGRLLHILPADNKRDQGLTEFDISKMPLKKQKAIRRKLAASTASFSWNSLYMNADAVLSSIADRLGVSKTDILDPTSSDAAIKQAHAETQLIKETKEYLSSCGVDMEAFKNRDRDDKSLLLKNFPYGTSEGELKDILSPFGTIKKFILPPSGTMAIVQYDESYSTTQALKNLAYKNIKGSVLFLEKAPSGLFDAKSVAKTAPVQSAPVAKDSVEGQGPTTTIFVRNLNFSTSSDKLTELANTLPGFLTARVKTRTDAKRPGEILSMGFGFMDFQSKGHAEAAVAALNGHNVDGHRLVVQLSSKAIDLAEEQRSKDKTSKKAANQTKIIIKNLPFQASKKDVRSLFAQYGQLKTVRVPRKFDNSTRGFAFAEFVTPKEAENAMDALTNTHLLGRRLVLQFAQGDTFDPEEEIRAIEKKVEQQSNKVQLNKLISGSGRKKFNVDSARDDE